MLISIKLLRLFGLAGLGLLPGASGVAASAPPSATLDSGVIIGTTAIAPGATASVNQFLGVPFAAKPVRFGLPSPPAKWQIPLNATKKAPACLQQFSYPNPERDVLIKVYDTPSPPAGESEDCLYLDVYVPDTSTQNKTVMFWVLGLGDLKYGSSSLPVYDGTNLATNQDVIFVAINYRLGVFGFPNSPQIPFSQQNVGFYDQRLALQWVQRNIHAFGGDPHAVTLWGEASGATGVDNLITTMPLNPPFRAAILQSGQAAVYGSVTNATGAWNTLAKQLNCSSNQTANGDVLSCVRAANATTIVSLAEHAALAFTPVKDNITELQDPEAARRAGNIARVPILLGTTAQDGRVFEYNQTNTTAFLLSAIGNHPVLINEIEQKYPINSSNSSMSSADGWPITNDFDQLSAIYTDATYQCPLAIAANDSLSAGIPTWRYLYNATFSNIMPYPWLGVYHASEVPLIFGNLPPNSTAFEKALSAYMQKAWADFAKYPQAGAPWPQYPTVAVLGSANPNQTTILRTVNAAELDTRCAFLDVFLGDAAGEAS